LVDIWYHFWQYEPINSAILNILEGDNREFIGYVFRDMLGYDSTPCVVAWDTVKNKVSVCVIHNTVALNANY